MGQYNQQPDFATKASAVTPSNTFGPAQKLDGSALYVGGGGDVSVIMKNVEGVIGNTVRFSNVPDGSFLPVIVDYVAATGTTATSIVAIK